MDSFLHKYVNENQLDREKFNTVLFEKTIFDINNMNPLFSDYAYEGYVMEDNEVIIFLRDSDGVLCETLLRNFLLPSALESLEERFIYPYIEIDLNLKKISIFNSMDSKSYSLLHYVYNEDKSKASCEDFSFFSIKRKQDDKEILALDKVKVLYVSKTKN